MSPTGYEVEMYTNIGNIARALHRIANCMEAAEKRARETDPDYDQLGGPCSQKNCQEPVIAVINYRRYCSKHIDIGFEQINVVVKTAEKVMKGEPT